MVMVVLKNQGPYNRPQKSRALATRTPTKGTDRYPEFVEASILSGYPDYTRSATKQQRAGPPAAEAAGQICLGGNQANLVKPTAILEQID